MNTFNNTINSIPKKQCFQDKESKQILKQSAKISNSISATAFNRNGKSIFANVGNYDYSNGIEHSKREERIQSNQAFYKYDYNIKLDPI